MLEHWKTEFDKRQLFGALLTDLSKTFDCLSHELIIAKLNAYGFSLSALKLIHNYLSKGNIELMLTSLTVHGKTFFLVYQKVQY